MLNGTVTVQHQMMHKSKIPATMACLRLSWRLCFRETLRKLSLFSQPQGTDIGNPAVTVGSLLRTTLARSYAACRRAFQLRLHEEALKQFVVQETQTQKIRYETTHEQLLSCLGVSCATNRFRCTIKRPKSPQIRKLQCLNSLASHPLYNPSHLLVSMAWQRNMSVWCSSGLRHEMLWCACKNFSALCDGPEGKADNGCGADHSEDRRRKEFHNDPVR